MGVLLTLISLIAGRTPRPLLLLAGKAAGLFWFYVLPVRRRIALAHIKAALGDTMDARERWRTIRYLYVDIACNVMELLAWRRLLRAKGNVPWIKIEGMENIERARSEGLGLIILTGHMGNYDLQACQQALTSYTLYILSKRLRAGAVNRFWMNVRTSMGVNILPPDGAFAPALAALRRGDVLGIVLDQHSREQKAIEAPFFGIPARTTPVLATLAIRSGCPIVYSKIRRQDDGSHLIVYSEPFHAATDGSIRERIEATTIQCLAKLEDGIRANPEGWLWLHRRWKAGGHRSLVEV